MVLNKIGLNMAKCIFGIINIKSIELSCSFMVEDFVVTLIPKQDQASKRKLRQWAEQVYENDRIEWLSGITSDNKVIHIARRLRGGYRFGTGIDIGAINFFTTVVIEYIDSSCNKHNGFYGIEFIGGDINLVYPPDKAIDYTSEPYGIQYTDSNTYTKKYDIELNEDKFRLIKTIDVHYVMLLGKIVDLSKNIKSKLRIEFDQEKPFDDLLKYYGYIRNLITFLTRISNNIFAVKLLTKDSVNGKPYYKDFANVRLYSDFAAMNSDILTIQDVLKLDNIGDGIVELFKLLNNDDEMPNLLFLPDNLKEREFIKYTQIVDICSAIETEYKLGGCKQKENKDLKIKSRNLAKQINTFVDSVDTDDLLKEKARNIIGATLKNYSPSLREKIKALYDLHKDGLELVIKNHHWIPNFTDEIFYKHIKQFIEMRNRTAHQKMNWNGGEAIYTHIMILIYLSIFERANISRDIAINSINNGFRNIF